MRYFVLPLLILIGFSVSSAFAVFPVLAEEQLDLLVSPLIERTIDPHVEPTQQNEVFIVRDVKNSLLWHIAYPKIDRLDYVEGNTYLISAKKSFTLPLIEPPKYELVEIKHVFKSHKPYNNTCVPGYHVWTDGNCVFAFRCSEYAYPGKLCVTNSVEQKYLRPLQQQKAEMLPEDVICLESLQLALKPNGSSACVNSSSVDKLLERGFTPVKNNNDAPYN